jgi:hypothetical protein
MMRPRLLLAPYHGTERAAAEQVLGDAEYAFA